MKLGGVIPRLRALMEGTLSPGFILPTFIPALEVYALGLIDFQTSLGRERFTMVTVCILRGPWGCKDRGSGP